ncbi:hypothetical protein [Azotobacter beijerinckii]|uniref:Histidine kinase n=1 Tax=Azotobacter beijerinckii TaxID=170623 RepID=A0A1I1B741_9GAMM|nr:hypothetical protein [Azotobacter beijerinckii]SFB46159.1 hypothetical protein SAMN04244571_02978 [Azotobacter beijerinckii]
MHPDDKAHDPLPDDLRQMIQSTLVGRGRPVLANALVRLRQGATMDEVRALRADLQVLLDDLDRLDALLHDKAC